MAKRKGEERRSGMFELFERYGTEEKCLRRVHEIRTEEGWKCPRCGSTSQSLLLSRRQIQCTRCSHQEAVTAGTPFYRSHIPLTKWFQAMYIVANDKRGASALRLAGELRVRESSAAYLLQRIRAMMAEWGFLQRALG